MADETVVAVYDTAAHAQAAVSDLRAASVPESAISLQSGSGGLSDSTAAAPARGQGFWAGLLGGEPERGAAFYERSLQGGLSVVAVKVPDQHVAQVIQILETHYPVDLDERADSDDVGQAAPATSLARPATDGGTLQLAEERLVVGKRLVNRGSTSIRRYVVETPVEQQVTLQDEKVTVQRRPVTDARPAGDAAFTDNVIEVTATAEEPVVSKTVRVVEEVSLRKEAVERVETVHGTVRKEEAEIERIPASTTTTTGTAALRTPRP